MLNEQLEVPSTMQVSPALLELLKLPVNDSRSRNKSGGGQAWTKDSCYVAIRLTAEQSGLAEELRSAMVDGGVVSPGEARERMTINHYENGDVFFGMPPSFFTKALGATGIDVPEALAKKEEKDPVKKSSRKPWTYRTDHVERFNTSYGRVSF